MVKFSIIIPVYNAEDYLEECILSVVNQSYSDFELLLVDDGSQDNSPEICDHWAEKDHRIKVFHKENGGLSDARNCGIDEAVGDYIWFVDSDDWIVEDSLNKLINVLAKYPTVELIQFLMLGNRIGCDVKIYKNVDNNSFLVINKEYVDKNFPLFPVMQFLIKREIFSKYNLKFLKGVVHEDIPFGHMLIYYVNEIYIYSEPLYNHRIRPGSITTSSNIRNCYSLIESLRLDKLFVNLHVKGDDKVWYIPLLYDYFYEIFLRIYPFVGTEYYKSFMSEYGLFLKKEIKSLKGYLSFKRYMLLCICNMFPRLFSSLLYLKRNWRKRFTISLYG